VLAGTNNNDCYEGATVVLLNDVCHSGAAQDSLAGGNPAVPDSARVRLVLPRFCEPLMKHFDRRRIEAADIMVFRDAEGRPRIAVNVGVEQKEGPVGAIVTLDFDLHPLGVTPSDAMNVDFDNHPDLVRALDGLPLKQWLEKVWLPRAVRFEAGHWPGSVNGLATVGGAAATTLPNPAPIL